jgi:hypothetical protein
MKRYLACVVTCGVLIAISQAASAESWNCQLSGRAGLWQTDGADLVGPLGALRYPIVRDVPDFLVGLSEPAGGRMEMVVLNRRSFVIQTVSMGLNGEAGARDTGRCTRADTAAAIVEVRPLIRSLARQAQNLASQGYTTAANLKLVEAEGEHRLTPEENRLIAQVRAYIATKPRR